VDSDLFVKQTVTAIADYLAQELAIRPNHDYRFRDLTDGPRVVVAVIDIYPRHVARIASMAEALSMAAKLDKGASVRVARGNRGTLCLEIPKPSSLWYNIGINALPRRRGLLATVGLNNDRQVARVNFANPLTPHVLLAGTTGSGKTNAERLFFYGLARGNEPDQVNFVLIDTKKRGRCWQGFADIPHLGHPIITDEATALRALLWAVAETDRRATSGRTRPHLFIGIDEAQDLLDKPPFVKVIGDIAGTGREFGVHLLVAVQNPTAKQLGDAGIKRNLTTRLVGRVDSATAAHVATGQKGTGAEALAGAGDMLLVDPGGVVRLTAALLTSKDVNGLPHTGNDNALDLGEYEDPDHVLAQADNEDKGRADDLDPRHVAVALVAEKGITWLANRLSIGSAKAKRVLDFANALRDELRAMGAYTAIPPDDSGGRNEEKEGINGMVVCRYKEIGDDQLPEL